jgi:hypothetical protein
MFSNNLKAQYSNTLSDIRTDHAESFTWDEVQKIISETFGAASLEDMDRTFSFEESRGADHNHYYYIQQQMIDRARLEYCFKRQLYKNKKEVVIDSSREGT